MRLPHNNSVQHPSGQSAAGVTLVEVLMALMIMSIGVSSVAVLFPISALRSIQASQMTNGAIVKYGVETLVDIHPHLIFDPDGDQAAAKRLPPGPARDKAMRDTITEHFRSVGSRNYVIDPVGFYTNIFNGDGAIQPNGSATGLAGTFGNDGSNPFGVPRYGGGLRTTDGQGPGAAGSAYARALMLKAQAFASQGDGWETQMDAQAAGTVVLGTGANAHVGAVQLSTDLDLSQVPTSQLILPPDGSGGYLVEDPEMYRIVLFSPFGKFSQAYPLVAIDTSANVAYFSEDINGNGARDAGEDVNMDGVANQRTLAAEFGGEIDRVLLQSRKLSDYSWMLNVRRRGDGQARSVDVVVRFNDGVSAKAERVFEAAFVPGTSSVWVRLPSRSNPGDPTEPSIRKGKFVFDATNGVWYRIQDILERPAFGTGSPNWANFDFLVTVEKQIRPSEGAGSLASAGPFAPAMFPTGIVDVYPMGSRNLPESLQISTF